MKREEFLARFPNATESTIRRNVDAAGQPSPAQPQHDSLQRLAGPATPETRHPAQCLVRVESRRVRLQDPDNAVVKWHIDALRYAGVIPDDTSAHIQLSISQTKVATKAEEGTLIHLSK